MYLIYGAMTIPAEHVVWIVIGTALYRNRSIWYITEQMRPNIDSQACVPSAVVHEPPRLYRRVYCLSQAALSDSLRLS